MSTQKPVRQEYGTVEENALRIDEDKAEQLIDALNTDLAATEVLYHQLRKHHWTVHGAEYRDLHLFYQEAYETASEGADHIAERVQALGGVPTSRPADFQERSPVEPEPEDIYEVRTMMKNDEEMYGDIIERVREHIELAENLGDYATSELLREQLEDLEEFAHEIEHFLAKDSLTKW
ncbi:MAG TPA: DNA starvation/stationary phase protection protein DpsA [Natronoarchaeum rubrum]|nr:DNA starvation/stationary phase protection protein DpsA [Natronoarchaeum rubrum]